MSNEKSVDQIRVPMNGGYLVASRNSDPNYDGITIVFESNDGDIVDIAVAECKKENGRKLIDVYTYEDVYCEDVTRKYTINSDEISKAMYGVEENS